MGFSASAPSYMFQNRAACILSIKVPIGLRTPIARPSSGMLPGPASAAWHAGVAGSRQLVFISNECNRARLPLRAARSVTPAVHGFNIGSGIEFASAAGLVHVPYLAEDRAFFPGPVVYTAD